MRYKLDAFCEIDKYAVESYCAIHKANPDYNLGDITSLNMDFLSYSTMICGGSPCQDFSVAGKGKGNVYECEVCEHVWNPLTIHYTKRDRCPECGSKQIKGTRSSLVVYYLKAVRSVMPRFGLYENVKALTNKKHRDTFELFLKELQEYGYNTYWKVLNAKDFGIPQNRERVIVVFIRKDVDNGRFVMLDGKVVPWEFLSMLDGDADASCYVGEKRMKILMENLQGRLKEDTVVIGSSQKNAYVGDGSECPSLTQAMGSGGGQTPMVVAKGCGNPVLALMEENVPESCYITGEKVERFLEEYFSKEQERIQTDELKQSGYINGNNATANRVYDARGLSAAIKAEAGGGGAKTGWYLLNPEPDGTCRTIKANYAKSSMANWKNPKDRCTTGVACFAAVRKLTPKECFRLMGFDDADYEAAKAAGTSNSQLYKQCGNSIVVDMLYYVLKALRTAIPELFDDLSLLSLFSGIGAFEKALDKLGGPMEHDWDWEAWERMQSEENDGIAVSVRNGNRHTPGAQSEQRVESEGKRVANTISTVEKDSMVMEVKRK